MARRLRIQFGGALYHVINRGNYRRPVFGTVGAARAFELTLAEVCARFAWRLHAYVILPNHFHLALETPQPNLVAGMHWLQSTFATRFNRLRSERGHLFQGRYQSLLIEDVAALVRVVNYIHLNPVRAKLVPILQCAAFRWSSLPRFVRRERLSWLDPDRLLAQLGFDDSVAGWSRYLDYLRDWAARAEEDHDQREFCSGWAIGTAGWKRAVARDYSHLAAVPDLDAAELREIRERRWQEMLEIQLHAAGRSEQELSRERHDAPWKIEIAARLRRDGIPYRWISDTVCMGAPHIIRAHVFRLAEHRSA